MDQKGIQNWITKNWPTQEIAKFWMLNHGLKLPKERLGAAFAKYAELFWLKKKKEKAIDGSDYEDPPEADIDFTPEALKEK